MNKQPKTIQNFWMVLAASALLANGASAQSNAPSTGLTLNDAYKDYFPIGVAINERQQAGRDPRAEPIIKAQYSAVSPENCMKWEVIHPRAGSNGYNFGPADAFVAFGESNKMLVVGHTLVWHNQTPRWVFQDDTGRQLQSTNEADRKLLLDRLHEHINTVVTRYKGRIKIWDVVNETLSDADASDTNIFRGQSPWVRILGTEFIEKAFIWAHEADPDCILRYNDYSVENDAKRDRLIRLIKMLKEKNIPVMAIGSQTHANLTWPSPELEETFLTEVAKLGLPIHITELDVKTAAAGQRIQSGDIQANASAGGGAAQALDEKTQAALAKQYVNLFTAFMKHKADVKLVTFWNVTDSDSWLRRNNHYPLLFDLQGKPKPAFDAVVKLPQSVK